MFLLKYSRVRSVKTQTILLSNYKNDDMFRLRVIRSILNRISLGTLSNSAHFWDLKMRTVTQPFGPGTGHLNSSTSFM